MRIGIGIGVTSVQAGRPAFMSGLSNANATGGTALSCAGSLLAYAQNTMRWGCLDGKRAVLVEAGATNLLPRSQDFSNWTNIIISSVSENSAISPIGDTTADTITATSGGNTRVQAVVTYVSGDVRTFSCFLRAGSSNGHLTIHNGSGGSTAVYAKFDLSGAGSVVGLKNATSTAITYAGNGWYRCAVSFVFPSGWTNGYVCVGPWDGTGDGAGIPACQSGASVIAWGAQFETGVIATSYIPTSGSAATRAADLVTAPITADVSRGVRVRGKFRLDAVKGGYDRVFQLGGADNATRIAMIWVAASSKYQLHVYSGGVGQGSVSYAAILGSTVSLDVTVSPGGITGSIGGQPVNSGPIAEFPAPAVAYLGCDSNYTNIPARLLCSEFLVTGV